jgi:hypothetical protein
VGLLLIVFSLEVAINDESFSTSLFGFVIFWAAVSILLRTLSVLVSDSDDVPFSFLHAERANTNVNTNKIDNILFIFKTPYL